MSSRRLNKRFYILLLLGIQLALHGQSLRFHRMGVNNGLSQNTVISVVQDLNGFIWMGTQDGLNRYDGYSFRIYRHADNDPASLSNNYVMSLAVDKQGNTWAGTTNGLNRVDGKSGQLKRVDLSRLVKNAPNYRIFAITCAENGTVYFGMSWGLFSIDTLGKISRVKAISDKTPCTELQLRDNKLWIGSTNKVLCYDCVNDKVSGSFLDFKKDIKLLCVNDQGFLYECGDHLYQFDQKNKGSVEVYKKFFNSTGATRKVVSVFADGGDEWICTETGLIWQRGKDTLLIRHIEAYDYSLSSDYVYCVYKDRAGLYWIGTSRGGFCIFNPDWQRFKTLGEPMGLHEAVWSVVEKGDTLILGTAKGIKVYRKKPGVRRLSQSFLPEQGLTPLSLPALQEPLKDLLVSSVCIDGNKNLWAGTENNGVWLYDFKNRRLTNFLHSERDSASLIYNSVLHLDTLSGNFVGVSTPYGFSKINVSDLTFKSIRLTQMRKGPSNNYTLKSWPDRDKIWFSSASGLCVLDNKTGEFRQFLPDAKNLAEQYHNIVSDIKKDDKDRYWVSTLGYGILSFDPQSGKFKKFGMAEGLSNETVSGILPGNDHSLWLGTNEGISKFDIDKGTFENFDARDGLGSKECSTNGFYKSPGGDLYFGTMSGLLVFDPAAIRTDTGSVKTVLTGIKINYGTIGDSSPYIAGSNFVPVSLNLDHNVKTISFDFAALCFSGAGNIQYKYKLQGFNDNWVSVTSADRTAMYTNLQPNTYTFTVIPVLHGKEIGSARLSFVVEVKPPFWLTWWFILITLVSGVLVISFIVRYLSQRKLKTQLRQAEEEQKLQKEKERISRELHDNVGSQLTYIIRSLDTLSYKSGQQDQQMVRQLDALSDFSRDTLSQLRESIWAINSKVIPLSELLARVHEYLNKINSSFDQTKIKLEADYADDIPLKPGIAINSFRIIQEAITNSLKYAEATQVLITLKQQSNQDLEFVISDNGKGFDLNSLEKKGYGLDNMRARALETGALFHLESEPGKGTRVGFLVPVHL